METSLCSLNPLYTTSHGDDVTAGVIRGSQVSIRTPAMLFRHRLKLKVGFRREGMCDWVLTVMLGPNPEPG